jgi:hypothetical protein
MFNLTKSEIQLVAFMLSVLLLGTAVKHFREKQHEPAGAGMPLPVQTGTRAP